MINIHMIGILRPPRSVTKDEKNSPAGTPTEMIVVAMRLSSSENPCALSRVAVQLVTVKVAAGGS